MAIDKGKLYDQVEISVPCKPEYVRTIRRTLGDFAESMHMPPADVEELQVATSEAVTNIIEHAYSGLIAAPPLRVKCYHRRNGLMVEIEDHGQGFAVPDESLPLEACIDRGGGMGITLIKTLMDCVNYDSSPSHGTRIRMWKLAKSGHTRIRPSVGSKVA